MLEVKKFKDVPWKDVVYDCVWYSVFKAENSKIEGHQIFVPKEDNMANVRESITAAYRYAY